MSLKDVKKGDTVIMCGFTGIKLGVFTVDKTSEKSITVIKKDGTPLVFSRKSGKQTNTEEGKEKYANTIIEDDGSYVAPKRKKKSKKTEKKKSKKKAAEEIEEVEETGDDFEEEFEDEDDDFEEVEDEE
mgnify:CR=1 FL=1